MSANIPGYAEEYVENRFPGSVVIWTSSAAGDQNPYLFCLTDYEPDGFPYFAKWLPGAQYQLIGHPWTAARRRHLQRAEQH